MGINELSHLSVRVILGILMKVDIKHFYYMDTMIHTLLLHFKGLIAILCIVFWVT